MWEVKNFLKNVILKQKALKLLKKPRTLQKAPPKCTKKSPKRFLKEFF